MTSADRIALATLLAQSKRNAARALVDSSSIVDLFERQVQARAQAPACISAQGTLSYEALNLRANQLAHCLRAAGVGAQVRVALAARRSPQFVAALLAIFKAGGVYVPLDPAYPDAYVQQMARDAALQLLLTTADLREQLQPLVPEDTQLILLDDDALLSAQPSHDLGLHTPADALACILYTSGSTGVPKGVMVPHRQILNWLHALWDLIPIAAGEIVAQKTSAAFAVSMKEFLSGLLAGAAQVLVPDESVRDANAFVQALHRFEVTRLHIVPSHLQSVLAAVQGDPQTLRALKVCITAGEPLTQALRQHLRDSLPWVQLWNNYGCTELNDTTYCAPQSQDSQGVFVPIGRPIVDTYAYVLDRDLHQVPIGVAGELCIHGAGIGHGYWNKPAMTAERFIANPFSEQPGARLYRTGDLVRYRDDGMLEYLGRNDFQIKVRGQRIDIHHVEHVLAQHPDVAQVVINPWSAGDGAPAQLVAYCVARTPEPGAQADGSASLRSYLSQLLPDFMVPTFYVALAALPRLPNGKLNRKALPAPQRTALPSRAYEPPQGECETRLTALWGEVLKLDRVGRHDNFFDLGGHSLLGAQLIAKIHQQFNVQLPLAEIFSTPTIVTLAHAIELALPTTESNTYQPIARSERKLG